MPSYSRFIRGEKGWLLSYKHRLRGIKTHYFFNPQILEGAIFNSSSHRKKSSEQTKYQHGFKNNNTGIDEGRGNRCSHALLTALQIGIIFLKGHLIKLIKTLRCVHTVGLSNFTSRTFYPKAIVGQVHHDSSMRTLIAAGFILYPSPLKGPMSASV